MRIPVLIAALGVALATASCANSKRKHRRRSCRRRCGRSGCRRTRRRGRRRGGRRGRRGNRARARLPSSLLPALSPRASSLPSLEFEIAERIQRGYRGFEVVTDRHVSRPRSIEECRICSHKRQTPFVAIVSLRLAFPKSVNALEPWHNAFVQRSTAQRMTVFCLPMLAAGVRDGLTDAVRRISREESRDDRSCTYR